MPNYMDPPSAIPSGSTVWAYLRDSGGSSQEQSVPQQEAEIRQYCKKYGLKLSKIFSDIGESGSSVERRMNFMEMMDLSEENEVKPDCILIWNFARFSRNLDDSDYYKALIRKRGIWIHSLTDPIPDGQWSGVVEKIIDIANEEKLRQNSRDVKRGLESIVKQGYAPGGTAPRGYKSISVQMGVRSDGRIRTGIKWEPDSELWDLVKLAWNMRAKGKPIHLINQATQGKLFKSLSCWSSFFKNRSYLGIGKCGENEYPNHHEAAIDIQTWEAVQNLRKKPRSGLSHHQRISHPSLFSGLAYCGQCGSMMVYHNGSHPARSENNYPFYICGKKDSKETKNSCNARQISAKRIDSKIIETVFNKIETSDYLEALLQETTNQIGDIGALENKIMNKRLELNKIDKKIKNLLKMAENYGHELVIERIKRRISEKQTLSEEIEVLESQKNIFGAEITKEALAMTIETWRNQIDSTRDPNIISAVRNFLDCFIERIELDYETIKIKYSFSFD